MKKTMKLLQLLLSGLVVALFLSSCGGGSVSTNQYLGKLPGIAKKYTEKIDTKKKEIEACTDMNKAFKLNKEVKALDKESDKAIEEYLKSNPPKALPFEQKADYPFTIKEIMVDTAYSSSISRISFMAKVKIDQDILNNFGNPPGFARNFFAYFKAVDKEGKSLTRSGVLMNRTHPPFKANMEVEMYGSLDGLANLTNFAKLVFISKVDYDKTH